MNNKALAEKVTDWLKREGYPLEMKVAEALRRHGFSVGQGIYYQDPETKNDREIDLVAHRGDDVGMFSLSLVIECKSTRDKPWVLFHSDDVGNRIISYSFTSRETRKVLVRKFIDKNDFVKSLPWFLRNTANGYGLVTALTDGKDLAYAAVMSALKAAISVMRSENGEWRTLAFVFPVVVLDGRLFQARLDRDLHVDEIERGTLTNSRKIDGITSASVQIVTMDALEDFCAEAKHLSEELQNLLEKDIALCWDEFVKSQEARETKKTTSDNAGEENIPAEQPLAPDETTHG